MSEINHYLVSATIKDSVVNAPGGIEFGVNVAVLATDEEDATDLVTQFFHTSGIAIKVVDGVFTLYRTESHLGFGAMRTVRVTSIVPHEQLIIAPLPAEVAAELEEKQETSPKTPAKAEKSAEKAEKAPRGRRGAKTKDAVTEVPKTDAEPETLETEDSGELQTDNPGEAQTENKGTLETQQQGEAQTDTQGGLAQTAA